MINQGGQQVEDVRFSLGREDRDRCGRGERRGKHAEAGERLLLLAVELGDTPIERCPQRSLACRHVPCAGRQVEHVPEPAGELLERHDGGAGGDQFDRQRQAVQAPADSSDRLGIRLVDREAIPHGRSPSGEQLDSLGLENR